MSTRSGLYRAARLLGTMQAAERGPGALAKRTARRAIYRKVNGQTARWLRRVGL